MEILKSAAILVIGFVLLIKGADFFVEGSSSVAKKFNVPSLIIGMTIVAMGTSLPELAVSVTASITGNNTLAVSNVSGSNIFNLMVVCGACALFAPLTIEKNTLMKEFPFSIVCAGLLVVFGFIGMKLGRIDGIIFLVIFVAYPCLLLWLLWQKDMRLYKAICVPLDGFIIVTVVRTWINRKRPYEIFELPSVIPKDTKGHSWPSRHVFSAAVIAFTLSVM